MRALAHPVRIKLLGLLTHAGTLTATQASEAVGESPANCAFHLRTLAKYGFVEEAGGGRGRERPWRRSHASIGINASDDPEYAEAATAFAELASARVLAAATAAMRAKASWPQEWRQLPARVSTRYLTPAEAAELSSELDALLDRYESRLTKPDARPPDSVPIEFLLLAWPELDKLRLSPHHQRGEEH